MADIQSITPGTTIQVKVVNRPTTTAAIKTLRRVLAKDEAAARHDRRQSKLRSLHFRTKQRGGRQWPIRMPKIHALQGETGEQGTIVATPQALRDLASVQRFVEVTPA